MIPTAFQYVAPASLEDVLSNLSNHGDGVKLLAGGQSLLSVMKLRLASPTLLVDLKRVPGLASVEAHEGYLAVGALTTYAAVLESEVLRDRCPLLAMTASVVGDVQVRNRGTLGGSIMHADPTGDMPAAMLALDAEFVLKSSQGQRIIPASGFFQSVFSTAASADEVLIEVRLPKATHQAVAYLKASPRPSDFAVVGVAVRLRLNDIGQCLEASIAVTGVAGAVYRALHSEAVLTGSTLAPGIVKEAARHAVDDVTVRHDTRATREYRAVLTRVYVERAIWQAVGKQADRAREP